MPSFSISAVMMPLEDSMLPAHIILTSAAILPPSPDGCSLRIAIYYWCPREKIMLKKRLPSLGGWALTERLVFLMEGCTNGQRPAFRPNMCPCCHLKKFIKG